MRELPGDGVEDIYAMVIGADPPAAGSTDDDVAEPWMGIWLGRRNDGPMVCLRSRMEIPGFGGDEQVISDPLEVEGFTEGSAGRAKPAGGQHFGAGPGLEQMPGQVVVENAAIVAFRQPVTGAVFPDAVDMGKGGFGDLTGKDRDVDDLEEVIGGRGIINAIRWWEPEDILPVYEWRPARRPSSCCRTESYGWKGLSR